MKLKSLSMLLATIALTASSCSNDSPDFSYKEKVNALAPAFWETYGFQSKDSGNYVNPGDMNLTIPISGVIEYSSYNYYQSGWIQNKIPNKVKEGMEYNNRQNCKRYNYWAMQYNDTACVSRDEDMQTYRPHPYAITKITIRQPWPYGDKYRYVREPTMPFSYDNWPYHKINYPFGCDMTPVFKIRYRSYYDYIQNGYSWQGIENPGPWYEMDLEEFNARGGAKMVDISEFYLIAKVKPQYRLIVKRRFEMTVTFENGKTNHNNDYLSIYSRF